MKVKHCEAMLLVCLALCVIVRADEFTIKGTVIDTSVEISGGVEPVIRVTPVASCTVFVVFGCSAGDESYFAVTDEYGCYSLDVNEPAVCGGPDDQVAIFIRAEFDSMELYYRDTLPLADIPDTLAADPNYSSMLRTVVSSVNGYTSYMKYVAREFRYQEEPITVEYSVKRMANDTDTLRLEEANISHLYLLTTSGDTAYDTPVGLIEDSALCYVEDAPVGKVATMGWTLSGTMTFRIPDGLEDRYPDFADDRQLTMAYKIPFEGFLSSYKFTVIKSDMLVVATVEAQRGGSAASPSTHEADVMLADGMHLVVRSPGMYSLELFSPDGRLLKTIVEDRYFSSGKHILGSGDTDKLSAGMVIAVVKGSGFSRTMRVVRF